MLIKENVEIISNLLAKVLGFAVADEQISVKIKKHMDEHNEEISSQADYEALIVPFVFDEKIDGQSIAEIYEQKNTDLTQEEKEILKGFDRSVSSVFEIKKVLKNGFELFSLVNESKYTALTMVKMSNFRGVAAGQYLLGRLVPCKDEFYLVEIVNILSSLQKEDVLKYAVAAQIQDTTKIYADNEEKLRELNEFVEKVNGKFKEFFKSDNTVITTSTHADDLIGNFNDYVEDNVMPEESAIKALIETPQASEYFEIEDIAAGGDFIEAAAQGFSSHEKTYDVGILCDKEIGLFVVPFYATFNKIFDIDDYKTIVNYDECIKNFLQNDKIPPFVIKNAYEKNPEKFLKIVNEVIGENLDIEGLLHKYKQEYFENKKFSTTTILYTSKAFNQLMGFIGKETQLQIDKNVGRNEPCPCGSGKKYKKCCGK